MSACPLKIECQGEHEKYVKKIPWFDSIDRAVAYGLRLERRRKEKTDYIEELSFSPLDSLASISMVLIKTGAIVILFSAVVWVPQNTIPKEFSLEENASVLNTETDLNEDQIFQAVYSQPIINTNVIAHPPLPPSPPTNLHPLLY